jgi:hypothetical protein
MKEKYSCKYDKCYVACFYKTGDEHRDLLQREDFLPSEGLSVSKKAFLHLEGTYYWPLQLMIGV